MRRGRCGGREGGAGRAERGRERGWSVLRGVGRVRERNSLRTKEASVAKLIFRLDLGVEE